jgi:hypothetical protein
MSKYLTEEEFKGVQAHIKVGDASLTISRSIARRFFMRVSNASIRSNTGNSALLQKTLVWLSQACALFCLLTCGGMMIDFFGWWAALAVPVAGASWAILAGLTNEDGEWLSITILLAASMISYSMVASTYSMPLIFFVFSLWLHRMTYILAQKLLIDIVEDSYAAYDMLAENIEIQDAMMPESVE